MTKNKSQQGIKLFPKILLIMLFVSLVPLGSYWYLNYSRHMVERSTELQHDFKHTSDVLVRKVDSWVDMNERVLRQNTMLPDMVTMDPAKQVPLLKTIAQTYEWLIGAHVIRHDGMSEARSDGQAPRHLGDREYFQQVMSGKPFGAEVVVTRATGKPGLSLAAPIHNAEKDIVGVLFLMSHLTSVSQAVTDVKIGRTGFAILLDETGKAIAHGRPAILKETLQDMRTHPALMNKEAAVRPMVYEAEGKRILTHTQTTQRGWTLITQQDYDEAFASLYVDRRHGIILVISTMILFSVLAYVLAQRLATPIRRLTAVAEQMSLGQLDQTVTGTKRGDELGALARAITRLGISTKMAMASIEMEEKKVA